MSYRPALRPDVVLARDAEGAPVALVDPILGGRTELGPISRRLVEALDGRTLDEALRVTEEGNPGATRTEVEASFRALLLLSLIEGAGTGVIARARAARAETGPLRTLLVLEGTRVGCRGSGSCCQGYAFGPLSAEDLLKISRLDLASAFPGLGAYVEAAVGTNAEAVSFLATREGRCVFLEADHRCGLHARFGRDAKPGFCQMYPLRSLPTIDGIKVYDTGECASFATSATEGTDVATDLARLQDLIARDAPLHHPAVLVAPATPVDFGHILAFQDAAGRLVDATPGAFDALHGVAAFARAFGETLAACPLGPGEPEATLERALRRSGPIELPAATPAGLVGLGRLAAELARVKADPPGPEADRLSRELARMLERIERAPAIPAGPGVDDVLRHSLRTAVFGDRLVALGSLPAGVLRLALAQLLASAGARLAAEERGAAAFNVADLGRAHHVVQRTLRQSSAARVFAQTPDPWPIVSAALSLLAPTEERGRAAARERH